MAAPSIPYPLFHYRAHTSSTYGSQRVWLASWFGDQFEVLTRREFGALTEVADMFSLGYECHDGDD